MDFTKTISVLGVSLLLCTSCSKDEPLQEPLVLDLETENFRKEPAPKISVCHFAKSDNIWEFLEVNENSLENHLRHGDAVDMDGDGFFNKNNGCGETDCDDNNAGIGACELSITWDGPRGICDSQLDVTEFTGVSSFIRLCQGTAEQRTEFSLNTRQSNFELGCIGGFSPISGKVTVEQNGTVVEAVLVDIGSGQGVFQTPFNIDNGPITSTLLSWEVGDIFICDSF